MADPASIIIRRVSPEAYIFNFPRIGEQQLDRFHDLLDLMEIDLEAAAAGLLKMADEYPEFLDAHHHLALALQYCGRNEEAAEIWAKSFRIALKVLPNEAQLGTKQLLWGFHANRPFLRLCMGHACSLKDYQRYEEALAVFTWLLNLNPSDNQGARACAITCLLHLNRLKEVLKLCARYPGDMTEELVYGKPLALLRMGKAKEAAKSLCEAVSRYPKIAAELLKTKHRKPPGFSEDSITVGGPDQAYLYWKNNGCLWEETPGALEFLRKCAQRAG